MSSSHCQMKWKSSFRCNMLFVPIGNPALQLLLLLYTLILFLRHSGQFPQWEHFNHDGRSIHPHPLHPRAHTHSLTHWLISNTHPLGGQKASFVWSVIALLSLPSHQSPLHASYAITLIRKITLQILCNNSVGTHMEPTEEYEFLSHLPSWHYLSVSKTSHSAVQE